MDEYVERKMLIKRLEITPILKYGIPTQVRDGVIDLVKKQTAADVVEVPPELRKTVELLRKEYEKARRQSFVRDPLAYALYQVWKNADGGVRYG